VRKSLIMCAALTSALFFFVSASWAHFAMIIPSTDNVEKGGRQEISLQLMFIHPFKGGPIMDLAKPMKFGVVVDGKVTNLLGTLKEKKIEGKTTWDENYRIKRPADYIFFMLTKPYWEPAKNKFVMHATKVIVDAMAAQTGWDQPIANLVGLPCEIVPLTRPYSLYKDNLFTGRVFQHGKPMPGIEVQVEWWGPGGDNPPRGSHATQVVKTDPNGIFSFAMPKAGWWGFAALMKGREKMKRDGKEKAVEQGAVIWVKAYPPE
jgi:cobalt/nickel transport protein